MIGFLTVIHIIASLLLIIIVLLQSGKSADLAGAFGGVGSQSTFGPRGAASLLSKLTTTMAILFMVTSLLLYITAANKAQSGSVMGGKEAVTQEQKVDPKKAPLKDKKENTAKEKKEAANTEGKPEKKKESAEGKEKKDDKSENK